MITQGYRHLITSNEFSAATALLAGANLSLPEGISSALGYYEDGKLLGTAFLCGSLICGVCIDPSQRGAGLSASLVGRLVNEALEQGLNRICIFTKAAEADKFVGLGFSLVASDGKSALLEFGSPLFENWLQEAKNELTAQGINVAAGNTGTAAEFNNTAPSQPLHPQASNSQDATPVITGAIVVNANPFTLGHRALAEAAMAQCGQLIVFVVQEDASVFPFALRLQLVREGLANIPKVAVLPAGPYIISQSSFPAYFTGKEAHAASHAALDATIFAARIAPALGISRRFVGSEPYCPVTSLYNNTLEQILPAYGVDAHIISRTQAAGKAISASNVRALMLEPDYAAHPERFAELVPPSTLKVILSEQGLAVATRLHELAKLGGSRH